MAESSKSSAPVAGSIPANDSMAAARAARAGGRKKGRAMSDKEKFAKRTIQQARSALAKLQVALENGNDVPASVIDACSKVTSAAGSMLFD